jgi:hypothetical protein
LTNEPRPTGLISSNRDKHDLSIYPAVAVPRLNIDRVFAELEPHQANKVTISSSILNEDASDANFDIRLSIAHDGHVA